MRCAGCGRFIDWWCQACWDRRVRSLRIRVHAAAERAGLHDGAGCLWWPT